MHRRPDDFDQFPMDGATRERLGGLLKFYYRKAYGNHALRADLNRVALRGSVRQSSQESSC